MSLPPSISDSKKGVTEGKYHTSANEDCHTHTQSSAGHNSKKTSFAIHMSYITRQSHSEAGESQISHKEEVKITPLFSGPVLDRFGSTILPQHGLLAGQIQDYPYRTNLLHSPDPEPAIAEDDWDPRIFLNVNTPWSAFVCGSQGSGKSHTLSCMLENCLVGSEVSKLPRPLTGIVFHYDKFSSYTSSQICEEAYLCSSDIPVKVLVSPTNFWRMKAAYGDMPGLEASRNKPEVIPLRFSEKQLDVSRMMNMMAVKEKDGPIPLYIEVYYRDSS